MFVSTIGLESGHEETNDNCQRIILFARNLVISNTTFPHMTIHKYTWKSQDGRIMNQLTTYYRGADYDTNHFFVICKFCLETTKSE